MKYHYQLNQVQRREFLRLLGLLGGAAAASSFLEACQRAGLVPGPEVSSLPAQSPTNTTMPDKTSAPTETLAPTPSSTAAQTPPTNKSKIAMVKTGNRADGVRKAINLLGMSQFPYRDVFIKPNFNSSDPPPGSTHPELLRNLVVVLREMGAGKITVGDRSGMGNTRQVMKELGVFTMAEELGFETLVFDEMPAEKWLKVIPKDSHWQDGFLFARPCLDCEALVQTCCLKTHRYGGHFTLSLKNSVGLVADKISGDRHGYMNELHTSSYQRQMIAEINTAYQPALIVLDGIEGFATGGPDQGKLIHPEVVLAGSDRIAIDAVGVAILRYFGTTPEVSKGTIFQQAQIARAVELGLGVSRPDQIELVTDDLASAQFADAINEILQAG